jgi:predicted outer membrane repeat protein
LNNIKFKNGNTNIYGGAILSFADLTVDHCTFTGNYAGTAGGAINSLGALNLKNSVFEKNTAGGDAGAVFSLTIKKSLEFYRSYFAGRPATADTNLLLAILQAALEPGKDTISNCVFTSNVAKGRGGGAVYAFSHLDVDSCTFTSNKASENGGAVFGNKDLFIKNSKFSYNSVKKFGGAVYFKCHELTGHYENGKWVSGVNFYNNLIESSTFTKNSAKHGGAIYGFKFSDKDKIHGAKAVKCTFDENKAQKGRDMYGGTTSKCVFLYYKVTLKKATIKKSAKKLVLKATLKKGKKAVKGQKIIFKFKGKKYKAKTNKKGVAKVTIKKSVLKKLKVGKKVTYTATYKASYGKETAKKTVKVKK